MPQAAQPLHPVARMYPPPYHPEFGYLAPSLQSGRRAWFALKAAALGGAVGAVAVIAVMSERNVGGRVALAVESPAPLAAERALPPHRQLQTVWTAQWNRPGTAVVYVAPTVAMPAAVAVVSQPPAAAVAAPARKRQYTRKAKRAPDPWRFEAQARNANAAAWPVRGDRRERRTFDWSR